MFHFSFVALCIEVQSKIFELQIVTNTLSKQIGPDLFTDLSFIVTDLTSRIEAWRKTWTQRLRRQ